MKEKQKLFRYLGTFIAGIGIIAIIVVCITKFIPTSRRMDPEEYFGTLQGNEAAIVLGEHPAQEKALLFDGNIYIDYNLIREQISSRFYWDTSEAILLYTTANALFEIPPNSSIYKEAGEEHDAGYEILKTTSSGMFLSAAFLQQYSNVHCELYEAPARVVITYGSTERTVADVRKKSVVRFLGGIKSPILTDVTEGSKVTVLEEMNHWTQVLTADGYIGYMKNSHLKNVRQEITETWYQGSEYTSIQLDERVNLVWHQIDYPEMNANFKKDVAKVKGVNVISPTWYYLSGNEGDVGSYASAEYVKKAHKAGYQVWALINNFTEEVSTSTVLNNRMARWKVQSYLVDQALELGFDGINIDFEGIIQEAGYSYVQFMRELSILCRMNGIILSVDVPVPMDFSRHYNRSELGIVCDYVIMMGYDEHYYGSEVAGSVASMEFERTGIENMLSEMSSHKLISAIPFYSRVWYTDTTDGSVTSKLVTMKGAEELLSDLGVQTSYDESTGQQYGEWMDDEGKYCQIWVENTESTAQRAAMVSEYNIGGIAEWVLGNEDPAVWPVIQDGINGSSGA